VVGQAERDIAQANATVSQALVKLEEQLGSGSDVRPELQKLLHEADNRWRGISHDTWQRAEINIPRPRISEILDVLARSKPVSIPLLVVSGGFLFSLSLGRDLPVAYGLFVTAIWVALVTGLGWTVNELGARVRLGEELVGAAGLLTLFASGVWFYAVPGLDVWEASGALTIHIANVFAALAWGFAPSLVGRQELVLSALRRRLDQATLERLRVESELVVIARQIAGRLHGSTRGEFLARVLAMQKALDRGDREAARAEIVNLRTALTQAPQSPHDPEMPNITEFLDTWSGFVEITQNLTEAEIPEHLRAALATVVVEAVTNSVRHGNAHHIDLHLQREGQNVVLTISNDGEPLTSDSTGGVGSVLFDQLASGGWSIATSPEGLTLLTLRFDINP
jgi:signal transduction histidine kinase